MELSLFWVGVVRFDLVFIVIPFRVSYYEYLGIIRRLNSI